MKIFSGSAYVRSPNPPQATVSGFSELLADGVSGCGFTDFKRQVLNSTCGLQTAEIGLGVYFQTYRPRVCKKSARRTNSSQPVVAHSTERPSFLAGSGPDSEMGACQNKLNFIPGVFMGRYDRHIVVVI